MLIPLHEASLLVRRAVLFAIVAVAATLVNDQLSPVPVKAPEVAKTQTMPVNDVLLAANR